MTSPIDGAPNGDALLETVSRLHEDEVPALVAVFESYNDIIIEIVSKVLRKGSNKSICREMRDIDVDIASSELGKRANQGERHSSLRTIVGRCSEICSPA